MRINLILKVEIVCFALFLSNPLRAQINKIIYEITARNLSLKDVDSYPQKLILVHKDSSTYRITLSTFAPYDDIEMRKIAQKDKYIRNYSYSDSINLFLKPTALTNCDLPEIKFIADSILNHGDTLSLEVIARFLKYSSRCITYDNELAQKLDKGESTTLNVETILKRKKGTCSEYSNMFISLMRAAKIPCRMVVGYIFMPDKKFEGSHAWAECYIKEYGWLAVDPQNGFYWYPNSAIKLFTGRDFIDCNIKILPDIYPIKVKILE
ncbi:MAG: transglutaminase-like domain-containing protein [Bacteroidaceae bacterium]